MARGSIVLIAMVAVVGLCNWWQSPAFLPPAGRPVQVPMASAAGLAAVCAAVTSPAAYAADPDAAFNLDPLDEAAKKLADACYPIFEKVDWVRAPFVTKWITTANQYGSPSLRLTEFSDRIVEAGVVMDQDLIFKAVQAHDKALQDGMRNPRLLAPQSDIENVFIALARMLKTAGGDKLQAIYDAGVEIGINNFNGESYASLNQAEVDRAYAAFLELGNLVKAR